MSNTKIMLNVHVSACGAPDVKLFAKFSLQAIYKIANLGRLFSNKLRYIPGFGLVEMAILTNPKPAIYRNLYENTGPGSQSVKIMLFFVMIMMIAVMAIPVMRVTTGRRQVTRENPTPFWI